MSLYYITNHPITGDKNTSPMLGGTPPKNNEGGIAASFTILQEDKEKVNSFFADRGLCCAFYNKIREKQEKMIRKRFTPT